MSNEKIIEAIHTLLAKHEVSNDVLVLELAVLVQQFLKTQIKKDHKDFRQILAAQILQAVQTKLLEGLESLTHYDRSLFRDGYTDDPADRREMFKKEDVTATIKSLLEGEK